MKRTLTSFLFLLFLILAPAQSTAMAYSSDPEKFIGEIIDEAKIILSSQDSQEAKAKKLSEIALKTVDINELKGYFKLIKQHNDEMKNGVWDDERIYNTTIIQV